MIGEAYRSGAGPLRNVEFQRETILKVYDEIKPLLFEHWREVAHFQDIELNPNYSVYEKCENAGNLMLYTAREGGKLIGYSVYFVVQNPHYQQSKQANQDIVYVDKTKRGMGGRFLKWCDDQLRAEGVQAVYHHVKVKHNFGKLLERMGYEAVDIIYAKRLDKGE